MIIQLLSDKMPDFNWLNATSGMILQISPDIRAVSALSRSFHQLANPYRFRNVHFMTNTSRLPTLAVRQIEEFLDMLEYRPEVKMWIRMLSIGQASRHGSPEFSKEYLAVEWRIHKVVPELKNLNSLRCGFMPFPPTLFRDVLQLPQLERLRLEYFELQESTSEHTADWNNVNQNKSPPRTLTVMTRVSPAIQAVSAMIQLLQQETLTDLICWPSSFGGQLRGDLPILEVISTHIPEYVFMGLRRLSIKLSSDVEVRHFVDMGARCPNLTTLSLTNGVISESRLNDQINRGGFALHHFPTLQRFEGPLAVAPLFTQGRRVHAVIDDKSTGLGVALAENEATPASNIENLKPGIPLRVLHVVVKRWSDADIEAVARCHPELEELDLRYVGEGKMVSDCSSCYFYRIINAIVWA